MGSAHLPIPVWGTDRCACRHRRTEYARLARRSQRARVFLGCGCDRALALDALGSLNRAAWPPWSIGRHDDLPVHSWLARLRKGETPTPIPVEKYVVANEHGHALGRTRAVSDRGRCPTRARALSEGDVPAARSRDRRCPGDVRPTLAPSPRNLVVDGGGRLPPPSSLSTCWRQHRSAPIPIASRTTHGLSTCWRQRRSAPIVPGSDPIGSLDRPAAPWPPTSVGSPPLLDRRRCSPPTLLAANVSRIAAAIACSRLLATDVSRVAAVVGTPLSLAANGAARCLRRES